MVRCGVLLCAVLMLMGVARAQALEPSVQDAALMPESTAGDEALPSRDDAVVLESLVVSGRMPGPGMWQVQRDGHTMWILGTLQPVAQRMEWESTAVERQIAASTFVLLPPMTRFDIGRGRLRSMMLVPSMLRARRNPDGVRLEDVVPAADYARWQVLKERWMGRDRGVEKRRPVFAAQELYEAAVEKSGLHFKGVVTPVLNKVVKKHGIPVFRPRVEITIADPKAAIQTFRDAEIDDVACFRKTLDHLEADLEKMRIRANAWARGDMLTLREITYEDQSRICDDALLESHYAKEHGIDGLRERLETAWLEAAEKAIAEHETSFAALPLSRLLASDGYLAALAARGYEIQAP